MKPIIVFLSLFICSAGFAQDSCSLRKVKDPFTNQVKLSTGFKPFTAGAASVSISADATTGEIDFFIWIKKEGFCFETESTAELVWEGERSRTTLRNSGSMNCNGAFHFTFKNTSTPNSWLRKMIAKRVASIKLTGNGGKETVITLSEEQKATLQRMATCITAGAASLQKK